MAGFSNNRWGDDEDYLPPREESAPDAEGIRTIVEYKFNEKGQKVKVTKRVKKVTQKNRTSKAAITRRDWAKFGAAEVDGGNTNVTYIAMESVSLEDPNADVIVPGDKKDDENIFANVKSASIVVCRHCGMEGDHWTLKCPYKDLDVSEIPTDKTGLAPEEGGVGGAGPNAAGASGGGLQSGGTGKYVPPSQRAGAKLESSSVNDDRDSATLRVTNISSATREADLQDLFSTCGSVARIYLAKDRETGESRGFAFVSFHYRRDAEKALNTLNGHGYDHLILKIEWAKPSNKPAQDEGSKGTTFRSGYGKALPQNVNPAARK